MPVFAYIALDRQGKQTAGSVPADSRGAAINQVVAQGLSPVSIEEQGSKAASAARPLPNSVRLSQAAIEAFTRELANLLGAGLPLARALALLKREASNLSAKQIFAGVHDDVVGGMTLADALAKWPRTFSTVYVAMIRAGEAGGFLDMVLQQIADFRAREADLKGRVKAALVYPTVLAVLATGVLAFLLAFFIPRFSTMFSQMGGRLPGLTWAIMALSEIVTSYGLLLLLAGVLAVLGMRRAMATDAGRRLVERTMLRVPGFGAVIARFALVRFCRMLGTLAGAGVPLVSSLRVARESLGNQTLADTVSHAIEEVQRGASLARSLGSCPALFPPSVVEMVMVAEESGRLDKELVRLSTSFESDLERKLRMLVALVEPAMLFIMAAIIGTVVVGMLLPVFTLQEMIK